MSKNKQHPVVKVRLERVVIRLPPDLKGDVDALRSDYFTQTGTDLSRATVVRVLVRRALTAAGHRRPAELLTADELAIATVRRAPTPSPSRGRS